MEARDVARLTAAGRIAIGAALVVAPRLATRGWIGRDADAPGATVLARALGARDLVMGALALHTLGPARPRGDAIDPPRPDNPRIAARWQGTLAAVDAVDLCATVAARRRLPAPGVALVGALATSAVIAQVWAARELAAGAEG